VAKKKTAKKKTAKKKTAKKKTAKKRTAKKKSDPPPEHVDDELYWDLAPEFLVRDDVDEGTIMGFPCLRVRGEFFATSHHRRGDLLIKIPAKRVDALIDAGLGESFAPAGRPFKEWVTLATRDEDLWRGLLEEAYVFAQS